jgi:histone acetyltransferase (RNA polymerase elongator complex component)
LQPDNVRIYPTVIIKDTELCDMFSRGEYAEHTVEDATEVCAEIVPLFENAGIGIIRLGLNPTDELSDGSAVGGAYHPALGELVQGRILLNKARGLLSGCTGSAVTLGVNSSQVSPMVGQHRCNITALCEEFGFKTVKVRSADVKKGEILITNIAK